MSKPKKMFFYLPSCGGCVWGRAFKKSKINFKFINNNNNLVVILIRNASKNLLDFSGKNLGRFLIKRLVSSARMRWDMQYHAVSSPMDHTVDLFATCQQGDDKRFPPFFLLSPLEINSNQIKNHSIYPLSIH